MFIFYEILIACDNIVVTIRTNAYVLITHIHYTYALFFLNCMPERNQFDKNE